MRLTLTPWMLPGLLGVAVACVAAAIAWRRRANPGARELLALSAGVGWWCLLQAAIIALPTLEAKVLASQLQYLGVSSVPLVWLWFAVAYTARDDLVRPLGWALLVAPEVATLLLAWTNARHGLVWSTLELVPAGSFSALHIEYGPWFQLHLYYVYGLVMVGTSALLVSLLSVRRYRSRALAVVAAALLPLAANQLYLLRLTPERWIDLTPLGFALGGLVLTWSLLRDEFLELPPVARNRVVDAITDGVVVLDAAGRVRDLNPAAAELLGCRPGDRLGAPWAGDAATPGGRELASLGGRTLEISRSALDLPGGGTIITVRDVTEHERLQRELREVGQELRRANEELARQASTDELTGLANRRQFLRVLDHELRRAGRYAHPLSLLLLDVDHFKGINDSLGHRAGDVILRAVADTIQKSLRDVDTVGRLGGDELAVVLPETDAAGARITAQRLLKRIAAYPYPLPDDAGITVTASIGLVAVQAVTVAADELMDRADAALYAAKAAGRNQLRLATLSS